MKSKAELGEPASRRLSILTQAELQEIYQRPTFTKQERIYYLKMSPGEEKMMNSCLANVTSKVHFILQLGYFKFSFRFFKFTFNDTVSDVEYVLQKYFPTTSTAKIINTCNPKAVFNHRAIILELFQYRLPLPEDEDLFLQKARSLVFVDSNPKYIFKEIVRLAYSKKIILPGYTTLQDIISSAITEKEKQLFALIAARVDPGLKLQLNDLLAKESDTRYQLTLIKSPQKSFTFGQANNERKKLDTLNPIFEKAKIILKEIGISNLAIKYYATMVDKNTIQHLAQFQGNKRYFYLLCFIYYRYLKINDTLVKTFLYLAGKYKSDVKQSAKEAISELNLENRSSFKNIAMILHLIRDNKISDSASAGELRAGIYSILPINKFDRVANFLSNNHLDISSYHWAEYDKIFGSMKRNIRHIFKSLQLSTNSDKKNEPVFEAVTYLQEYLQKGLRVMKDPPDLFIFPHQKKHISSNEKNTGEVAIINPNRYEILVYQTLKRKMESSDIFVPNSMDYRSIESDLIDSDYFEANKFSICNEIGLQFLKSNFSEGLKIKLSELEELIQTVNKNILENKNSHFKFNNNKTKWHLNYDGVENKEVNNPIFNKIPEIDLPELLWLIQKRTGFLRAFTHILKKHSKAKIDEESLLAAIIACGTNNGPYKMASMCSISYPTIKKMKDCFLREETLKLANEIIINAGAKLEIQRYYDINSQVHSSIVGKKYYAVGNVFNSRYSPKYFGLARVSQNILKNAKIEGFVSLQGLQMLCRIFKFDLLCLAKCLCR